MKISPTIRRIESSEKATDALDEMARENNIVDYCYDESIARLLSEFDAMRWTTLCAQRTALLMREFEQRANEWLVPVEFRGIYESKPCSESESLENVEESLSKLAA